MAEQGPETWHVGSQEYRILSTHYEWGAANTIVYVMSYTVEPAASGTPAQTALPLIRYAVEHHTPDRVRVKALRGGAPAFVNLAVDLVSPKDHHVLFRYEVPAGEVTWRLAHPNEP
jgi:hypothetical protein